MFRLKLTVKLKVTVDLKLIITIITKRFEQINSFSNVHFQTLFYIYVNQIKSIYSRIFIFIVSQDQIHLLKSICCTYVNYLTIIIKSFAQTMRSQFIRKISNKAKSIIVRIRPDCVILFPLYLTHQTSVSGQLISVKIIGDSQYC